MRGGTIDGAPDTVTPGQIAGETVDGSQGGLSIAHSIQTDVPGLSSTSYYLDKQNPSGGSENTVHGRQLGVRLERAVDQPRHSEHRPAQHPVQQPDGHAHALLGVARLCRRCEAGRPGGQPAAGVGGAARLGARDPGRRRISVCARAGRRSSARPARRSPRRRSAARGRDAASGCDSSSRRATGVASRGPLAHSV